MVHVAKDGRIPLQIIKHVGDAGLDVMQDEIAGGGAAGQAGHPVASGSVVFDPHHIEVGGSVIEDAAHASHPAGAVKAGRRGRDDRAVGRPMGQVRGGIAVHRDKAGVAARSPGIVISGHPAVLDAVPIVGVAEFRNAPSQRVDGIAVGILPKGVIGDGLKGPESPRRAQAKTEGQQQGMKFFLHAPRARVFVQYWEPMIQEFFLHYLPLTSKPSVL
jgi:hypothetical protein